MHAALFVDDDKGPPVAAREDQIFGFKRGGEARAVVALVPAIADRLPDLFKVGFKAARLLELAAIIGGPRFSRLGCVRFSRR